MQLQTEKVAKVTSTKMHPFSRGREEEEKSISFPTLASIRSGFVFAERRLRSSSSCSRPFVVVQNAVAAISNWSS